MKYILNKLPQKIQNRFNEYLTFAIRCSGKTAKKRWSAMTVGYVTALCDCGFISRDQKLLLMGYIYQKVAESFVGGADDRN